MNPKLDLRFLPLILVLVGIPRSCVSQNNDLYETCSQPFQCGRLGDFGYPFYGGNRSLSCGYPGFQLDCRVADDPLITTASMTYRVLDLGISTQTLKVSRDDLWSTLCPPQSPSNTTLNFTLFNFYSRADDQNITIYYGCTAGQPNTPPFRTQFNCGGSSFFTAGTAVAELSVGCSSRISVRVNQSATLELTNNTTATTDLLQGALRSGFSIQWSADNDKCRACSLSGGFCGYNPTSASFACHCTNATSASICSAGNRDGPKMYVIVGVLLGMTGLITLSIIVYYITKRCRVHQESNHDVDKFLLNHGSLAPKRYSYNEIKKMTKSFTDKLGQGGYGIVYKGKIPDGQIVAVKVLTQTHDNAEDFINEVASISRTSHVNIVNLLGFCYDGKQRALVYEFMANKSLDKFISNSDLIDQECSLEWEKLFEIAVGVARGLEYLHRGCNTSIVHFDIKPQNILLDKDFCPKISDFGLAQLFKKKQSIISTVGARGTIGYIAPEVFFRSFGAVSHKSDVYSYGMMLLEMAEAKIIVVTGTIESSENYFPDIIYEYVLLNNKESGDLITEEKEETKRKMLLVGFWCIQTPPSDRPSMTKVVEMLEGSLQSIKIPPKPLLSTNKQSVPQFTSSVSVIIETENNPEG
ncbi:hypothetical protein ACS0TY_029080 [Phlomoides rotata]